MHRGNTYMRYGFIFPWLRDESKEKELDNKSLRFENLTLLPSYIWISAEEYIVCRVQYNINSLQRGAPINNYVNERGEFLGI